MKTLIENYAFNAATRQVTFTDYSTISAERILLITNVTDGIVVYQFNLLAKLGAIAGNVLTLTFDTTAMSNSDKLQIFYDDDQVVQSVSVPELNDAIALLNRILISLVPLANTDSGQRQLVTLDSISTNLTLTTVGSITTLPALAVGSNTIGNVNLTAGTNTIGDITVGGAGYDLFIVQQRSAYNISMLQT
jgi:hypothetical protein